MLQSDWTRNDEAHVFPVTSGSQRTSATANRAAVETGDLNALLADLSPNKRAVIETLLGAWGIQSQAYLEQTG